ncbi:MULTISPECIES: NfeD family protein [Cyanophyceae]|nr:MULTISPECIES: NfeD family protein [Cyanophyceae]MCD8487770.1 NfeD family protein [Desertifilum sp.]MDA0212908.1 NfeD family protein [Cyanobacteria bacterium FC1]MDI9638633.1 NfeD family protein [Geitlerinema splendidum]MDL5056794.1 NfeD family protein [Geitlerinema calcuttense NRMC-F 0142]
MMLFFSDEWDREAIVDEEIPPRRPGRAQFRGSYWMARCQQPILLKPGTLVRVIEIRNTTLIVEPVPNYDSQ